MKSKTTCQMFDTGKEENQLNKWLELVLQIMYITFCDTKKLNSKDKMR